MTTTTDKALRRIIALRDQANHSSTGEAEAQVFRAKALELCTKHGIDAAILDKPTEQVMNRTVINGQTAPARKYSCRFGCGMFVQHTIDELNACAEKARNRNGGNAYAGKKRDPFEDLFGAAWGKPNQGPNYGASSSESTYTDSHGRTRTHQARATGSHAYCDHEATKSARAKCRKARGY